MMALLSVLPTGQELLAPLGREQGGLGGLWPLYFTHYFWDPTVDGGGGRLSSGLWLCPLLSSAA